ncbi:uncharacterized protein LOC141864232 isoform X1 [Acropora palmata]|uniref:uncharacterized protein LOC141864232 isoform X1 n=1 Tax=Acropora palmata TaxID=6131 RepID=UPI003DA156BE
MSKAFWSTTLHFQGCSPFNESENFQFQPEHWKAFQGICWECIHLFLFFSPRALQRSSCCPSLYVSVTIHIPIPSSHTSEDTSDAPGAIATEAPEGTYILPVTEHKKQETSPAVNLIINLRLLMDLERKPEHGEPLTILSDGTPKPILKATPAEYIAHEGKVLAPSSNLNSIPHQDELSTPPNSRFSSEVHLNGNFTIGQQQPQRNSIGPAFLFIPKRRVLHNVRSVVRAFVPGDKAQATELPKFREQILSAHNLKRQIHKVPLLAEDNQLDTEAQGFAMKLANQENITHSSLQDRLGQGENIAIRCALKAQVAKLTGIRATNLWYDEGKNFNWNLKSLSPATQRFTQMVWKNTTKAGFGRAKFLNKDGKTCFVVVARYAPAGNVKGKLMDNVLLPSKRNRLFYRSKIEA